ncbi:MAG: putative rane protein [Pseudomonas sp.]|nr:putative rane protein [Pseudomonas sp.]
MPLQLIIMGMLQSFIIFIINAQQLFIMSMLMPGIGIILHFMLPASTVHSMMHFIIGIGMPIGIIGMFMSDIMDIIAMPSLDMHIIDMLAQCIIIGMPQFIIIDIISALFLNIAMSMPAAGVMVHIMASAIISHFMVAMVIGMPIIGIIGIIGIEAFIGICIAFIMVELRNRRGEMEKDVEKLMGGF